MPSILPDFIMDVGSRTTPGAANLSDGLAGYHGLSTAHGELAHMAVQRAQPILVLNLDHVPKILVPARLYHFSTARRQDVRPVRRGEVNAVVVA